MNSRRKRRHSSNFTSRTVFEPISNHEEHAVNDPPKRFRARRKRNRKRTSSNRASRFNESRNSLLLNGEESFGVSYLKSLLQSKPDQIVMSLNEQRDQFTYLLHKPDLCKGRFLLIWAVLSRATSSESSFLSILMGQLREAHQFTLSNLQEYLLNIEEIRDSESEALNNICNVMETLQRFFPNSTLETLQIILPALKEAATKGSITPSTAARLTILEETTKGIQGNNASISTMGYVNYSYTSTYKHLPVLPMMEELLTNKGPTICANIVKGRYKNVEHYLDVQYKLLREDYVRPVREGIASYIRQKNTGDFSEMLKSVNIYHNSKIIESAMSIEDGVVYKLSLNGKGEKIGGKSSNGRILLPGSLLCLSSNHFQSVMLAIVCRREDLDFERGVIQIRFINSGLRNYTSLLDSSFDVIETPGSYFEAYKHTLTALRDMEINTFPLKEYIVELSTKVSLPSYLSAPVLGYDNPRLLITKNSDKISHNSKQHQTDNTENLSSRQIEHSLDASQISAVHSALNHNLAIIQGPPGTGKSFVGLKIVELLLKNRDNWSAEVRGSPILVICYTNHALDQFLEGVLEYTRNIVRVGGRCQHDKLQEFNLNYKRRWRARGLNGMKNDLAKMMAEISRLKNSELNSRHKIFSLDELPNVIEERHSWSLLQQTDMDIEKCLYFWLACFPRKDNLLPLSIKDQKIRKSHSAETCEEPAFKKAKFDDKASIDKPRSPGVPEKMFSGADESTEELEILKHVFESSAMTQEEVSYCSDIWSLDRLDRLRLYHFWINEKLKRDFEAMTIMEKEFERQALLYDDSKKLLECKLMVKLDVVGMTATGAAKHSHLLNSVKPRIVIVEEAAEVLEPLVVGALNSYTQHLILIGDHKQLKPKPNVYELSRKYHLDVSLFERLIDNRFPYCQLKIQHRMRPCISNLLVPDIYSKLENHNSVHLYDDIKGMSKNMFFVTHTVEELCMNENTSKANMHEAQFLFQFCRYLMLQGHESSKITILTSYVAQASLIKSLTQADELVKPVNVDVIDNFQGEENDIILMSYVRSNMNGEIGFLRDSNRICVSLSRAKKGFYAIGNFLMLSNESRLWKSITNKLKAEDSFGIALVAKCKAHGNSTYLSNADDFNKVKYGGCRLNCNFRLECGHVCDRLCHPYDLEHEQYVCSKVCGKVICKLNHHCKKPCFDICEQCTIPIQKKLVACGHHAKLPCYLDPSTYTCKTRCEKVLDCGHQCQLICGVDCNKCWVSVTRLSPCGHEVELPCTDSVDVEKQKKACKAPCTETRVCGHMCSGLCGNDCDEAKCTEKNVHKMNCGHVINIECYKTRNKIAHPTENTSSFPSAGADTTFEDQCKKPCSTELKCGHFCKGSCGECFQGRIHIPCSEVCKKVLVCGHICDSPCSKNCPPCRIQCNSQCFHSNCQRACGEPCVPCREPCSLTCRHHKCNNLCKDLCDRDPCKRPCPNYLSCSHRCIGFCGEECPTKCIVCNRDELTTKVFGTENNKNARFVMLDCRHIFEVKGLAKYIKSRVEDKFVGLIPCPTCKILIRRSRIFYKEVKKTLGRVEQVKAKIAGVDLTNWICSQKLMYKLELQSLRCSPSHPANIMLRRLESFGKLVNIDTLIRFQNYFRFLREIEMLSKDKHIAYVDRSITEIFEKIIGNLNQGNIQLFEDISWELYRMNQLACFVNSLSQETVSRNISHERVYKEAYELLTITHPFRTAESKRFNKILKFIRIHSSVVINIEKGKPLVLKAKDMQQKHWLSCPNGHVYYIAKSGTALKDGCEECHASNS